MDTFDVDAEIMKFILDLSSEEVSIEKSLKDIQYEEYEESLRTDLQKNLQKTKEMKSEFTSLQNDLQKIRSDEVLHKKEKEDIPLTIAEMREARLKAFLKKTM